MCANIKIKQKEKAVMKTTTAFFDFKTNNPPIHESINTQIHQYTDLPIHIFNNSQIQ
jgi:hypothetical protein